MGGFGLNAPKFKGILVQVTPCQEREGRVGRKISFWEFWKEDAHSLSVQQQLQVPRAAPGEGSPPQTQSSPLARRSSLLPCSGGMAYLWEGKTHKSNSSPVWKQCKGKARNQWSNNPQHSNKTNILLCQKSISDTQSIQHLIKTLS